MEARRFLKWLKPVGYILGIFVLLGLGLIVVIRSPFVVNRVLPPIQAKLERDFNLKTKISSLSVDPFARLELRGIEADWQQPPLGKVRINVESVLVRFSIWELLNRKLVVSEIDVLQPSIEADLVLPAADDTKKPSTNPLPLLKQLIINPPASVDLSSIDIRDLKINVRLKQGATTSVVRLQNLSLASDLNLSDASLSAGVQIKMDSQKQRKDLVVMPAAVELKNVSPEIPAVYLEAYPSIEFSARVTLSFQDLLKPYLELSDSVLKIRGESIQVNSKLKKAGLADLRFQELRLDNTLPSSLRLNLAPLFELEGVSGDEFQRQSLSKLTAILKEFSFSAETALSLNDFRAQLRLPAQGIDASLGCDLAVPVKVDLSPEEFVLTTQSKSLEFAVKDMRLGGSAFKTVHQNFKSELLEGLKVSVPLKLRLATPARADRKKPLSGIRLSEFTMSPQVSWGSPEEKLLNADLTVSQNSSGVLNLNLRNDLNIKERLMSVVPALKQVHDALGYIQVRAELQSVISTQWRDLQMALEIPQTGMNKFALKYDLKVDQTGKPPKKSPTALDLEGGLKIHGNLEVPQPFSFKEARADTTVDWAGQPLLKNNIVVRDSPRKLTVSGSTGISALLRLRKITPLADQLGMLGGTQIQAKWAAGLMHGGPSILKARIPPLRQLAAIADVDAQIQFVEKPLTPVFEKNYLQFRGPLTAKLNGSLNNGLVNLNVAYELPHSGIPSLALVDTLKGNVKVKTKMDLSDGAEVDLNAFVGNVTPSKSFVLPDETLDYLRNIDARLLIHSDIKTRIDLKQGDIVTGEGKLKVNFKGGSDLKATNSRFEGKLALKPPKIFKYGIRAQDKVSLDGVIQTAWELTQKEQKSLRLRGQAMLENFSAQHQLGGLRNASGQIPFQQDLELPNFKSLKWSYLIQDNPFKRVDASKFIPLLSEDSMLVVDEVNALEKKFGPLRGRFSLKQNMLTVDRLDADVFEGVLAGQGFVDIQPSRLVTGLQGRITKLNTALLSAKPEKATPAPLSARLAMVLDLSKSLIEGRADVTEIGKNQLLAMIDVLDPSGADSMLNKARLALSAGYPTYVGLQMQQGYLNLDVGLGGLIPQRFVIPNLPLTPIINAKTQDLVKTIREVPIQ